MNKVEYNIMYLKNKFSENSHYLPGEGISENIVILQISKYPLDNFNLFCQTNCHNKEL